MCHLRKQFPIQTRIYFICKCILHNIEKGSYTNLSRYKGNRKSPGACLSISNIEQRENVISSMYFHTFKKRKYNKTLPESLVKNLELTCSAENTHVIHVKFKVWKKNIQKIKQFYGKKILDDAIMERTVPAGSYEAISKGI